MCAPCGFIPNNTVTPCQDYSHPHAAEAGDTPLYSVQPAMPRMGRRSTICCGWDFITAEDALAHHENH